MKKLLLLIAIISFSSFGQTPKGMVKIDKPERLDSFKTEYKEPKLDTTVLTVQVLNIFGNTAQIIKSGRKYNVSINPEINPFGYIIEADREYTVYLERDMNMVYEFQSRGQTRTIPARIIWFTPSADQLKRDQMDLIRLYKKSNSINPKN